MRFVLALFFCLNCAFAATPSSKLLETSAIRFEPRSANQVRWVARGLGYAFLFTDDATILRVGERTVNLKFPGSNAKAAFDGSDRFAADSNYFKGRTSTAVGAYARLHRRSVYPGVDLVYYGNGGQIEYDFEVAAGADPSKIRMHFEGADAVRLNDRGEVVLTLGEGEITQRVPVVYQRKASGEVVAVHAAYKMDADANVRLDLGAYNRSEKLVVDPTITYSAYLEGTSTDNAVAIAHDSQGMVYMAGNTQSVDFPATANAYFTASQGFTDVWVMKLDPTQGGNAIVYCSYLGGGATDTVKAMTIDASGVMYLTGSTASGAFPLTSGAYQTTLPTGAHVFVTMLDPSQSGTAGLIYSTYLYGSNPDEGDAVAVANGKIYVTGYTTSDDFPVNGAYQQSRDSGYDAFVSEIDPTQSGTASLVASTFLGASGQDLGRAIAVDSKGIVWVSGVTYSFDFPVTANAYHPFYTGDGDGFLTALNMGTGTLVYSTMLGGTSVDEVKKIVIEPGGHIGLAGYTISSDFPVTQGAYQTVMGANGNAFLTVIDPTVGIAGLGLIYSSYFGGSGGEVAYDLRRDTAGRYYLGGYTLSPDLPVTGNALNPHSIGGSVDGFVSVIDPNQPPFTPAALVYSSYVTGPGYQIVYGLDVDPSGSPFYVFGQTTSQVFPAGYASNPDVGKLSTFLMIFTLP